ncbi:MAG: 50S ribosomal protein L6 [Candidatus Pacearchaeota archaeon]
MKKDLIEKIPIEGITAEIERRMNSVNIKLSANKTKLEREFKLGEKISLEKKDNFLVISAKDGTKKEKRLIKTITSHIKNMVKGLKEPWVYKLEICYSHFPISVSIDNKTKQLIIKNFFGEKMPRYVKIFDNVNVEIKGNIIEVRSYDKELAGKQAALIENATRITEKDRRIFQDGIWIIEKAGKKI